jgi:hypothetical protein
MRNSLRIPFLALALCAASADALRAEDVTYYVPYVKVLSATIPGEGGKGPSFVYWASTIAAFNNSASPATLSYNTVFGNGLLGPLPSCVDTVIQPFSGVEMDTVGGGCTDARTSTGPGFVVLRANSSVVVRADVQRGILVAGCGGGITLDGTPSYNTVSQGSTPLPIYKGLVPANASAVAGPIDLGALDRPDTCITGPVTHRRRVNVTLFNGGAEEASFTVVGRRPRQREDPVFEIPVVLKPQEVLQLNSIPIPISEELQFDGFDVRIWLSITSTQPFLAYVTTIFEGGEPGTNAVTVYEARSSN